MIRRVIQIVKKKQLSVASSLVVSRLFLIKIYCSQKNVFLKPSFLDPGEVAGLLGVGVRAGWAGPPVTVRSRRPRRGQLPGLPKEGSQAWAFSCCLQSSQRPPAQEFTFHSPGFSSYGGRGDAIKTSLVVFFFCASFFFFLIFWV